MKRSLIALMSTNSANNSIMVKQQSSLPLLRGVVFDMDGTLTKPNLDFAEMYKRCGVDRSMDILTEIAAMPKDQQQKANSIIEEMEEEGRRTLELMPGATELTSWLSSHEIPIALVTRNTRKSANVLTNELLRHKAIFHPVIPRDDGLPPKPDPTAMHVIANEWSISLPSESIVMVGDSVSNDIVFGKNAGVCTALLDTEGKNSAEQPMADFIMDDLTRLPSFLWSNFNIKSPLEASIESLQGSSVPLPTSDLAKAAATGDFKKIIQLSKENTNFDINMVDACGNTALIWASNSGNEEIVKWIIRENSNTVDLDYRGYLGFTAANRASRLGHTQVLQLLSEAGADLDLPNDKLQYPLHCAAFHGHENIVQLLLQNGANPRVIDRKGRTPAEDTKSFAIRELLTKVN